MSNAILKGNASGTGSVTLESPNTNSDRTISLPDANGTVMVSGNMPAFSAYPTSGTSTSTGTWTKITFDTENFDTNSNFASSRFTPTVAGYYQITGNVRFSAITASAIYSGIYKNGSLFCQSGTGGSTAYVSVPVTTVVYLNGSTDYVEIYGYQNSGSTISTDAQTYVVFSGCLVRSA